MIFIVKSIPSKILYTQHEMTWILPLISFSLPISQCNSGKIVNYPDSRRNRSCVKSLGVGP